MSNNNIEQTKKVKVEDLYLYKGDLIRVVDGDTLITLLDLGFSTWHKTRLRLARINCPETRGVQKLQGLKAKNFVIEILNNLKEEKLLVKSQRLDSFGRAIAEVYINQSGDWINLNDLIVAEGHAKYKKY